MSADLLARMRAARARGEATVAAVAAADAEDAEWPEPIALSGTAAVPAFPLSTLPGWVRDWVSAEAVATQTPLDMPAMLALSVLSTACASSMRVQIRDGWSEPLCIYTAVVSPPGTRKSAVFRDATAPLTSYERDEAVALAPEIARSQADYRVAEQRLRAAEAALSKAGGTEAIGLESDMHAAVERLESTAVPVAPRLITGDATQEALARLLAAQGGCIAVMDAEGCGPIAVMLGRYARDGAVAIDMYLRGHAGDAIRVDRVGREPIIIADPAITVAVTTQPEVLQQLGDRRELRGLGLLARFLWVAPRSTVGRRDARPAPMTHHVRETYATHVRTLLAHRAPATSARIDVAPRRPVYLSPEADDVLADYQAAIEPRLGPGGDLEHVADWAGKLAGAVARIAGLLHAADHAHAPWDHDVSVTTIEAAIRLGEYLLAHAVAALGGMGADPAVADAEHILARLRADGCRRITRRDLYRAVRSRFARAADIDPALSILVERGWIRMVEVAAAGAARKSVRHIEVRPDPADPGTDGTDGTNGTNGESSVPSVPFVHDPETRL